ncbi:protein fantom-like isoform X2 [Corticium candelabrum]|uniref:protein fantom-like isoform X2 n=1 Tax=Corticium candelabrum TaxID=121492 RepID=UPI002E26D7FB|nr:protein fantom-like isoform X2 [Corticium candelabrum]
MGLKKKEKEREEKMKRMATKLLRLTADKKDEEKHGHVGQTFSKFDAETKEVVEDLQSQLRTVIKRNEALNNKLIVAKKQLETQSGRRRTVYEHIKPRISTGLNRRPLMSARPSDTPRGNSAAASPRYGHSLLEEARRENAELEDMIASLQDHVRILEDEASQTAQHIRSLELQHESEVLQMQEKLLSTQRTSIQEDVGLIRLQREVKERATKYDSLQAQYLSLQQNMDVIKASHARLLEQIEESDTHLKEEQLKNTRLQNQLKNGTAAEQQIAELHEIISDLQSEKALLKQTNDKLIKRAFDTEREEQHKQEVLIFETRIEQMQGTHEADLREKMEALDLLSAEREQREQLEAEHRERNIAYYQLKQEHDELAEKMAFLNKESAINFREIEEALVLIKMRKEKGQQSFDFLEKVDDEGSDADKVELQRVIAEVRASHADTISELDKTRKLLSIQHKLNKDYQAELESVKRKMESMERECGARIKEYAQLVDVKAARIKKLEGQLHDIAYGTRQYKIDKVDSEEDLDETVSLERGQNLFEIHIGQLKMSPEMLSGVNDPSQLSTLVSFGFYEYDTQFSPVTRGMNPDYDFTAQYVVQVDDFFLLYLQKQSCTLEVHRAFGTEYQTLAATQLKFHDILDAKGGRVHCHSELAGVLGRDRAEPIGSLDYWIRLRIPMDHALRLFRERNKALGYLSRDSTVPSTFPSSDHVVSYNTRVDHLREDYNELNIQIVNCISLNSNRENCVPSAYAVYKFFDFADHDTAIVQQSDSPEFNDSHLYPVLMNSELDEYLRSQALVVYVFDDADNEQSAYLGSASISLLPLAQNSEIADTFELIEGGSGVSKGAMKVNLHWQRDYRPINTHDIPTRPDPIQQLEQIKMTSREASDTQSVTTLQAQPVALTAEALQVQSASPVEQEKILQSTENYSGDEDTDNWSDEGEGNVNRSRDAVAMDQQQLVQQLLLNGNVQDDHHGIEGSDEESGSDNIVVVTDMHPSRAALSTVTSPSESDEDGLVVSPGPSQRDSVSQLSDTISVVVWSLTLSDDAPLLIDESIQQLFVEYKFLSYDAAELETPFSLPKKSAGHTMSYNFKKVFILDDHYRQDLIDMMSQDHPSQGCVHFTVVSEPPEDDQDNECIDIGSATVDLHKIVADGDVQEENVDVYDIKNQELVIGRLTVTVEAFAALQDIIGGN